MTNYNKQKQMYSFILILNLFPSSTPDFTVAGSGTLIWCNVRDSQCLRDFPQSWLYIYALQNNIN